MPESKRCPWAYESENIMEYHDKVWGKVKKDNQPMFRTLSLGILQAGLSLSTILDKLENIDESFNGFQIEKVASYQKDKIESILEDLPIISDKEKVEAIINNANVILVMEKDFSGFIWSYVFDTPVITPWSEDDEIPTSNYLSDKIASDMKDLGFEYIDSTLIYSFLQAIGLLNDHLMTCEFKFED